MLNKNKALKLNSRYNAEVFLIKIVIKHEIPAK